MLDDLVSIECLILQIQERWNENLSDSLVKLLVKLGPRGRNDGLLGSCADTTPSQNKIV